MSVLNMSGLLYVHPVICLACYMSVLNMSGLLYVHPVICLACYMSVFYMSDLLYVRFLYVRLVICQFFICPACYMSVFYISVLLYVRFLYVHPVICPACYMSASLYVRLVICPSVYSTATNRLPKLVSKFLYRCWKRWSSPCTGLDRDWGVQQVEAPRLQYNRHSKVVRLSALHTGRF